MPACCVQVMRRLVEELGGGQGPVGAQMRAFLMERCVGTWHSYFLQDNFVNVSNIFM